MSDFRFEIAVIAGVLLVWIGIFAASWQGKLGVSGTVSDGLLALLGVIILYRLWRLCRRLGRKGG